MQISDVTTLVQEKEEKLVQRDAMGLDLTRLRGALDERTREVIAIQTRNDALRASLACRRQEIEVQILPLHCISPFSPHGWPAQKAGLQDHQRSRVTSNACPALRAALTLPRQAGLQCDDYWHTSACGLCRPASRCCMLS